MMFVSLVALLAVNVFQSVESQELEPWRDGRATFYGHEHWLWSIHEGSCEFGYLCANENTGWDVTALPDAHKDYAGSCGRCYEVKCHGVMFMDSFKNQLDRSNVCNDGESSVVVRVVDTCPCNDVKSQFSNQRWCCGDMDHLDLSIWAFEKLADPKWGVIGLKYREVPCDHKPEKQAPAPVTPFPGMPVPEGVTCTGDDQQAVAQNVIVTVSGSVYANGIQEYWQFVNQAAEVYEYPEAGVKGGSAVCGRIFPGGAVSFLGPKNIFDKKTSLEFWIKGAQEGVIPAIDVNLGGEAGMCTAVSIADLNPSGTGTETSSNYVRYNVFMGLFDQMAPTVVTAFAQFDGCGEMSQQELRTISFINNQPQEQMLCLDEVQLLG
eukprot:TRINITY_DN3344_c1_g1_i1.p1 TRINITY_DN3344_c1_g1~~TRINITY_DN3344_c1_g1_i1.p1  ORF type:complete len:430 (-),score=47.91 TRINITY_DN3344_c1_g1_i1:1535-2668(-)